MPENVTDPTIEAALDELRPGLDSDGFKLLNGGTTPEGEVRIVLEALDNACLDCLVPDELLVQMLKMNIDGKRGGDSKVVLEKVGFDNISHSDTGPAPASPAN